MYMVDIPNAVDIHFSSIDLKHKLAPQQDEQVVYHHTHLLTIISILHTQYSTYSYCSFLVNIIQEFPLVNYAER